jgi:SAM-dependent methyltransferase
MIFGQALVSPETGLPLRADTPHSLTDGTGRWPVIDAIPFLRVGRADLAAAALARLDAGEADEALCELLADQDAWWDGPAPAREALRDLVRNRAGLSLRDAMARLGYGRVGDYFAHRWSDPTFVAGLALIEAHWTEPASAFELACGIGHYLRELDLRGVRALGADVVFSKLWLARHWVVGPRVALICFDAAAPWPVPGLRADLALCQDAFYFLEPKREILARLRAVVGPDGIVAVGHIHNSEAANLSGGAALSAGDLAALFPEAVVYDDSELTRAAAEARVPCPKTAAALRQAEAFSLVEGPALTRLPRPLDRGLTVPAPGAKLTRNPLYGEIGPDGAAALSWPSERYRSEYAARATYPATTRLPPGVVGGPAALAAARRREAVALPERW